MITHCLRCNTPFNAVPARLAKGKGKYCSRACRDAVATTRIERPCAICGKSVFAKPYDVKRGCGLYCSRACLTISQKGVGQIPVEIEQAILKAYQAGKSKREAAEPYGYSRGATEKILKRHGVPARSISEATTGKIVSEETRRRISENHADVSGAQNPMHGKSPGHGKSIYIPHLNKRVRSSWEAEVASLLLQLDIPHEYEPRRFILGNLTYTPDFRVELEGREVWIEVKGWVNARWLKARDALKAHAAALSFLLIEKELYGQIRQNPELLRLHLAQAGVAADL